MSSSFPFFAPRRDHVIAAPSSTRMPTRLPSINSGRTSLNPNAAEFVPSGIKLNPVTASSLEVNKLFNNKALNKTILEQADSVNSNAFDEGPQCYTSVQLPDDITPDYGIILGKVADDHTIFEESHANNSFEQTERASSRISPTPFQSSSVVGELKMGPRSRRYIGVLNPWEHQGNCEKQLHTTGIASLDFINGSSKEHFLSDKQTGIDPVTFLACEFPGFPLESLADVFHANLGDLSLTIEMLTQLQLQGPSHRHMQCQPELIHGLVPLPREKEPLASLNLHREVDIDSLFARQPSLVDLRSDPDLATVIRKNVDPWSHARNGNGFTLPSSKGSRAYYSLGDSRVNDTANAYSDLGEEACDHARLQNAYFEQARRSSLMGNKAFAKELSEGNWHDSLIKDAHNKVNEPIFQQRNTSSTCLPLITEPSSHMLDLHNLHVKEAIPRLKQELATLRALARSTHQHQQVFVCAGTGSHYPKGPRTPAKLSLAVEQLLSEERLNYSEPQPGMFGVLVT